MSKVFDLDKIWAYVITGTMGFLEPLWVLVLWFLIFVVVDMITGISASIKEHKPVTSKRMQKTVQKFIMYATCILLLHAIDEYMILFVKLDFCNIASAIICGIELYSVFENCYKATGNIVFKVLTQFTKKEVEEKTGVHIDE